MTREASRIIKKRTVQGQSERFLDPHRAPELSGTFDPPLASSTLVFLGGECPISRLDRGSVRVGVDAATTGRRLPFGLPDVPLSLSVAASLFRVPPTVAQWVAAAPAIRGRPTPCKRGHYVYFATVLRMVATTAGTPDALPALAPRLHGNANAAADRSERSCVARRMYSGMRSGRGLDAAPWDTLMLAPLHASPATVAFLSGRRGSSAAAVGAAADRLATVYAVLPDHVAVRVRPGRPRKCGRQKL